MRSVFTSHVNGSFTEFCEGKAIKTTVTFSRSQRKAPCVFPFTFKSQSKALQILKASQGVYS